GDASQSQSSVISSTDDSTKSTHQQDEYDVITGGAPIPPPMLPPSGTRHPVLCTLVSHPGHFYVRFINTEHDQQLANMTAFYDSDDSIELSLDVLRAGQFFAASRQLDDRGGRQW